MTDLPISHSQSVNRAGKTASAFTGVIAAFQNVGGVIGRATAAHLQRRAMRRAPEEILAAQARREAARRAVDRLLPLR